MATRSSRRATRDRRKEDLEHLSLKKNCSSERGSPTLRLRQGMMRDVSRRPYSMGNLSNAASSVDDGVGCARQDRLAESFRLQHGIRITHARRTISGHRVARFG